MVCCICFEHTLTLLPLHFQHLVRHLPCLLLAFLKGICFHFVLSDLDSSGWAKGYSPLDLELLCADGTRAAVTEWAACNLGPVPPSAVMARPVTVTKISDFLTKSQVGQITGGVSMGPLVPSDY